MPMSQQLESQVTSVDDCAAASSAASAARSLRAPAVNAPDRRAPAAAETADGAVRSPLQSVADAVARHYKDQFGRGPQRCRAHFAGRDAVLVILEGTMSPAERRLTELGEGERVRAARSALQRAVGEDLIGTVSAVAGRAVVHAVNGLDVAHDVATELFVLSDPDADPPPAG